MGKRYTQREDVPAKDIGGFHLDGFIVVDTFDIRGLRLTQGGKLVAFETMPDFYSSVILYVAIGETVRKIEIAQEAVVHLYFND